MRSPSLLSLTLLPETYAVCRLAATDEVPPWAKRGAVTSHTRTARELSIVCADDGIPADVRCERGWRCLRIADALDFALVGIVADLATPLADAGISVFVLSTYDTDYLLFKQTQLERAVDALQSAGHAVR